MHTMVFIREPICVNPQERRRSSFEQSTSTMIYKKKSISQRSKNLFRLEYIFWVVRRFQGSVRARINLTRSGQPNAWMSRI